MSRPVKNIRLKPKAVAKAGGKAVEIKKLMSKK